MKTAYPVIMKKGKKYIVVHVPDFEIGTQGVSYADAIEMARDAISLTGVVMQDERVALPFPSDANSIVKENADDVVTLVDVDFDEYRRKTDVRRPRRVSFQKRPRICAASRRFGA
jgi:predicted RNase H-like HicB family nuclease